MDTEVQIEVHVEKHTYLVLLCYRVQYMRIGVNFSERFIVVRLNSLIKAYHNISLILPVDFDSHWLKVEISLIGQ